MRFFVFGRPKFDLLRILHKSKGHFTTVCVQNRKLQLDEGLSLFARWLHFHTQVLNFAKWMLQIIQATVQHNQFGFSAKLSLTI